MKELETGEGAILLGGDTSNEPENSEPARPSQPSGLSIPPTPRGGTIPCSPLPLVPPPLPSPGTPASPLSPRIRQHSHFNPTALTDADTVARGTIDARDQEDDIEEALSGWDNSQRTTRRWWDVRQLWKGEGEIRLAED
ncbi:hypothetical protein L202_05663 [Cryptococcus amylolentus CBS 6039]|uniref:Uncharacterized protein n=2 Tax=Cryptococcus amylolentus TaxID=104669 RepID=A0A1E3HLA4_9TREE|nr:hypothetical protein L202_05663 [Cryptococcus amylolentus CBS 6039]ODN77132.1 hypothetical protein L202_05663 [Cryptococcus amylolentus CBS 6039]ODO04980.1 hypothetical protein I350_05591 [Cryptococcus amylolentus CBS 6273]